MVSGPSSLPASPTTKYTGAHSSICAQHGGHQCRRKAARSADTIQLPLTVSLVYGENRDWCAFMHVPKVFL